MKRFFIIAIVLLANNLHAQNLEAQKAAIDSELIKISHAKKRAIQYFQIQAAKKVFHVISYECTQSDGINVKIIRQFSHNTDTIIQSFYLKQNELIYATKR